MTRTVFFGLFLGFSVLTAAPGCSSSSSDGGSQAATPPPGVGEKKSVAITAATGGTLEATGVTLNVPAGALAADTTISVEIKDKASFPGADTIAVNVFEFGPQGTTFSIPVPMTLDLYGMTPPAGSTAKIAYLDPATNKWTALADSAVSGGKVTATTTHFTPFTIVWVAGQQTGGGCDSFNFSACGGNLVGTWSFTAACASLASASADPTGGKCPAASAAATVDFTGSITFNTDGTYSINASQTVDIKFGVPASCLPSGATCSQLDPSAVSDGSGGCTMTQSQAPKTISETGTYTSSGTTFTTTKSGSSSGTTLDYCVNGTTALVHELDDKGNTIIYQVTKQ